MKSQTFITPIDTEEECAIDESNAFCELLRRIKEADERTKEK